MIEATKHRSKEKYSLIYPKSITVPNCQSRTTLLLIIIFHLGACSSVETPSKEEANWNYPPANRYPSIMKQVDCQVDTPCILVELKPESLQFVCTLRNDSPYYWCGVNGIIANPDPNLPQKVGTVFHSVVSEKTKKVAERLISTFKKTNKSVFLISPPGYFIDDKNEFTNKMFGIYNEDVCADMFYDFSICPRKSKKFHLYD